MGEVVVVIPARWASSRFPGKVLAKLGGKPLVLHACELARQARLVDRVLVAADDSRVESAVSEAGFEARMTSSEHPSGTDRVAEVARGLQAAIVVGLQADEPFLDAADIDQLVETLLSDEEIPLASLASPLRNRETWFDPNAVKVVTDSRGRALYFSRSPIPYHRPESGPLPAVPPGPPPEDCRLHLGIYAWRREALLKFAALPPSPLEKLEGLEQLRALEAGWSVAIRPARGEALGIDTPEDLRQAEARLARRASGRQEKE